MFNFREELAKYRESLEVESLQGGVSGDEVRDILDVAKALVGQGDLGKKSESSHTKEADGKNG